MNGYKRTLRFVQGQPADRPPFMPLVIEWVSRQQGIPYPDFVYDPKRRAEAYLACAERFHLDCILPDADFYEQLEDFGAKPVYGDGGFHAAPILSDLEDIKKLQIPAIQPGTRMGNRLDILRRVAEKEKSRRYIFGICIGPFTEYTNARGLEDAFFDMADDEEAMMEGVRLFYENGLRFIDAQLEAGADGIQIVEPSCSLINPAFYQRQIQPLHKAMVERIQKNGGFARLHICGDTHAILPYTLGTGARILDVDHAVRLEEAAPLLGEGQVFCGNLDPSGDVLLGTPDAFPAKVRDIVDKTGNRIIISGGCDIPPDTSAENMDAFFAACDGLKDR